MDIFQVLTAQDWAVLVCGLAALGSVAGFLAGLLGIGGGIVLVPGLLFLFSYLGFSSDALIHVCVGTSLALIVPNGLMSARAHWKKAAVDFGLVKQIGVGVLIGVVVGIVVADVLSGEILQMVFACAIVVLAAIMVADPSRFQFSHSMPARPVPTIAGGVIGSISSLIGIGGGTLSVPFMTTCGVAIHRAIGTASALGVVIAVPAALGFVLIGLGEAGRPSFSVGYVNVLAWGLILPTSLLSVRAGVWVAHKAPVDIMRKVFAAFLVVVAVKMWIDVF